MEINWKIISLILGILLIVAVGLYAYNEISKRAYQLGFQDANFLTHQQILNSLQQNGYVPFTYDLNNKTQTIILVPQLPNQ